MSERKLTPDDRAEAVYECGCEVCGMTTNLCTATRSQYEEEIARLREQRDKLRGFAREMVDYRFPPNNRTVAIRHGLLDRNLDPTPLLTGEGNGE